MSEQKTYAETDTPERVIEIPKSILASYFPENWTDEQIETAIYRACELSAQQIQKESEM